MVILGKSGNFMFNQGKPGEKEEVCKKSENQGSFKFHIVLCQSKDFPHTQSHIQLSMTMAKFYPFVYHSSVQLL